MSHCREDSKFLFHDQAEVSKRCSSNLILFRADGTLCAVAGGKMTLADLHRSVLVVGPTLQLKGYHHPLRSEINYFPKNCDNIWIYCQKTSFKYLLSSKQRKRIGQ